MTSVKPPIATESLAPGVGAQLRRTRELQGLSLLAAAQQLRLSERLLTALEQENQAALPAPVYVRGYLRHYAQLLRLNPEAIVAQYPLPPDPLAAELLPARPVLVASTARHQAALWQGGGAFGLLLLLGLPMVWWHAEWPTWLESPMQTAADMPVSRGIAGSQITGGAAIPEPAAVSDPDPALTQAPLTPNPVLAPVVLAAATPAMAPAEHLPPVAAAQTLKLVFQRKTWVDILDAQGTVLLKRAFKPGTEHQMTLTAPVRLRLKPTTGVTVQYGGQVIPVPAPDKSRHAVLTLGQD